MSSAQTWTLIGGFLAILVAMNALVLALVHSWFSGLRSEMTLRFDSFDRDLQRLYERVFHEHGEDS